MYSRLSTLKGLGFNQLALEALNEKDTSIISRKYPISNYPELITGVYTKDSVHGNLIRKVLALGFELISYDTDDVRIEKDQARNILQHFDRLKGKLIVLGGYGHIEKMFPMIGYHLQEGLDEELLSISQITPHPIQPLFPGNDTN